VIGHARPEHNCKPKEEEKQPQCELHTDCKEHEYCSTFNFCQRCVDINVIGHSKPDNKCVAEEVQPEVEELGKCASHSECDDGEYCSTYGYCQFCQDIHTVGHAQEGHKCEAKEEEVDEPVVDPVVPEEEIGLNKPTMIKKSKNLNIKMNGKINFVKNDFMDEVFDISDNIYAYEDKNVLAKKF